MPPRARRGPCCASQTACAPIGSRVLKKYFPGRPACRAASVPRHCNHPPGPHVVADRVAILVDAADYFAAAKSALEKAKSSIHMLNWAFDPDTKLCPGRDDDHGSQTELGAFLVELSADRPELAIRILCWKSAVLVSATQNFFPHRAKRCFRASRVEFHLDATVPFGACHHQKVIIVDGQVAFTGSSDFCPDRWDTSDHTDADPRRR
eukprot:gene2137-2820_t